MNTAPTCGVGCFGIKSGAAAGDLEIGFGTGLNGGPPPVFDKDAIAMANTAGLR